MDAPSPCCTLPFTVLALPSVASTKCPWAPDWKETQSHGQDRTWMFCNAPSTENSESCFSATLFYAHPCCRNYTLLLFTGLRHTYFYLCDVTNLYSTEARFFACPNDGAFQSLWTSFTFPLCFPCRFSFSIIRTPSMSHLHACICEGGTAQHLKSIRKERLCGGFHLVISLSDTPILGSPHPE